MEEDGEEMQSKTVNSMQETGYLIEESKKKFIHESFKIDENKILNQDEKLNEEVIKMLLDNFLALGLNTSLYRKTDLVELK